jgi:hypothetical protein
MKNEKCGMRNEEGNTKCRKGQIPLKYLFIG